MTKNLSQKPCRYYGSSRGCDEGNSCPYSHKQPDSIRICINHFSIGCTFKKKCRFRHQKYGEQKKKKKNDRTCPVF